MWDWLTNFLASISWWYLFSILVYLAVSVLVSIYVIYHYSNKRVFSLFTYVVLFVSLVSCFASIALVTIDLSMTLDATEGDVEKEQSFEPQLYMKVIWYVIFWLIQVLSWVLIPLMQSYEETGEFTILFKLIASVVENAVLYGLCGALILVGLVVAFIIAKGSWQFMLETLPYLLMTFSNIIGFSILVFIMGYGLSEFPRSIWYKANLEREITFLEFKAANLNYDLEDARDNLKEILTEIRAADREISEDAPLRKYVDKLLDVAEPEFEKLQVIGFSNSDKRYTRGALTKLNKKLKRAINTLAKYEHQWDRIKKKAFYLEDILEAKDTHAGEVVSILRPRRESVLGRISMKLEWIWQTKLRFITLRVLSVALFLFSLALLYCEIVMAIQQFRGFPLDISPLSLAMRLLAGHGPIARLLMQLIAILSIAYLSFTSYFTLFRIKIFNYYQLLPRYSGAYSLLFACLALCRVMPPLCWNFIRMVKVHRTAFTEVMGKGGEDQLWVQIFFMFVPIILGFTIVLSFFNVYSRVLSLFKVNHFIFEDKASDELADEGREILLRERRKLEKSLTKPTEGLKTASRVYGGGSSGGDGGNGTIYSSSEDLDSSIRKNEFYHFGRDREEVQDGYRTTLIPKARYHFGHGDSNPSRGKRSSNRDSNSTETTDNRTSPFLFNANRRAEEMDEIEMGHLDDDTRSSRNTGLRTQNVF